MSDLRDEIQGVIEGYFHQINVPQAEAPLLAISIAEQISKWLWNQDPERHMSWEDGEAWFDPSELDKALGVSNEP